ncbi:MAG: molybdopterin-dependent oxidoreductase [Proteobacteria bacterium]|nr:molybdopterin-dependent oxidoreductase [Pseudomonadota bacterium]MBU1388084.1 molybdopterin-dependent oxidoreductase [Pseudomonadota bacterium]MBU1542148.1 molybdopterin-dependent oxidoreductase [Pseudomonadota bacterium]MBU2429953.1 molybdopterin-dependent oxidoreductase [Pseudomonadota bacterium]MBU2481165.1 molybdopterin-dependent oxidoreductase [Pseudomonadota bacterium]
MTDTKHGICGICFHSPGCGVIAHFDASGRLDWLEPDTDTPSGKVLCPMAASARQIIYSDHRLKHPLKRVGPKGTHEFEEISWDEAFDIIVEKLNHLKAEFGPETVGFYAGTGSYERSFKDIFQLKGSEIYLASSILFPFGSPNTFGVGAPCYTSLGVLAPKLTMGCLHIDMFSDVDNSDLILIWGTDPSTSTPPEMFKRIITAANEGAQIIVIDPRKTLAADLPGSEWLPIRPGTDGALALGLSHILIRDRLYDEVFVEDWTLGFDEFSEYVKVFTPEHVSAITGIDTDRIESLAESIVDAEGASYIMYTGLEYTKSGVQNIRAVMVLWALAGQMDVEGGRCFSRKENRIPLARERQIQTPGFELSIGKGRFPVYSRYCGGEPHASLLPKSIIDADPYKIRALFVLGASLLTSWPDPGLWKKALGELDFLVTIDLQMTQDAAWADIVLPATTAFEQESYCYYGNAVRIREKLIEPVGDSRSSYDILAKLADRLGYGHLYPRNPDEVLDYILSTSGFNADQLRNAPGKVLYGKSEPMEYRKWEKGLLRDDGKPGFETPSGKFEIKSSILEKYGYPGLPEYEESDETPQSAPKLFKRYPLILGTGPFKPDMKSCLRGIPDFMEKYPYPVVEISVADAQDRGIKMADRVVIKTDRGSVAMRAFVTDKIMKGFVYAPVGGGGPIGTDEWKEANVNFLIDSKQYDEISGFPVYKTMLCEVKKKKRQRRSVAAQDPSLGCVG